MTRRRITLAFILYVTLDLSSPFVPGSFNFEPDECVEGIHRVSAPEVAATTAPARLPIERSAPPLPTPVQPVTGGCYCVLEWLIAAHADARSTSDPPPPGEDH